MFRRIAELRALRPLLFLLTAFTVLLAVVTTSGRVATALLPRFEARINTMLIGRGVEIGGLDGAWHWLNPIVRIDTLRFVGGRARGVTVELDVVESAIHGALVARHLSATSVELTPTRNADGRWRLGAGGGAAPAVSIDALLRYSDGLDFPDVRIVFMPAADAEGRSAETPLGELHVRATLANTARHHSGALVLGVVRGGDGEVNLAYDVTQGLFSNPSRGRIALRASDLMLEPALGIALGGGGATIETLSGDWSFADGSSSGALTLSARDVVLPTGALDAIEVAARGSMERFGLRWALMFDRIEVRGRHNSVRLDGAKVALTRGLEGSSGMEFSLPEVDLAPLTGVVRDAGGGIDRIDEWLTGLNPRGRLSAVVGRYDLIDHELSYGATASDLALEEFKGVPYVRNGSATVVGTENAVQIDLAGRDVELGFFSFYDAPFRFDQLSGQLLVWFRPGYLALSGRELSGDIGATRVRGQFALGRPEDPLEQRILATARMSNVEARDALMYVPKPLAVHAWLDTSILGGHVDEADLLYHGHLRAVGDLPMRQTELRLRLHDALVRFHSDWPPAESVGGEVLVTTTGTRGEFDRGSVMGIDLAHTTVSVSRALEAVEVASNGNGDGAAMRALISASPLSTWLTFVKPDWTFAGPFDFAATMRIPIKPEVTTAVDLTLNLGGLDVLLADMNLELGSLRGPLRYQYPVDVDAKRIDGMLFGNPAGFSAQTQDGRLRIQIDGRAEARAITDWRKMPNPGVAAGEFDFSAEFHIQPGAARPPTLAVKSDLVGVALNLPPPLGKSAEQAQPSTLGLVFAPDRNRIDIQLGNVARGWLRMLPSGVPAGSIGIGVAPAPERGNEDAVTLSGAVERLDLSEWFGAERRSTNTAFAWAVDEFKIGRASYRNIGFDDIVADAWGHDGQVEVSITAPELEGSLKMAPDTPAQIDLHYLKMPARDGEKHGDPLANVDARVIGDLDVVIQSVQLGADDYGKWQFQTRKLDAGLAIANLAADVKGLHIESPSGTSWTTDGLWRTRFNGQITAANMAEVLPQWNYAATVETESTRLDADIGWVGSPFNFSLPIIDGRLAIKANNGRFVDAGDGTGAVRIFSLLNFAAIAKRMTLDFSDVFGKGISFDKVTAVAMADQGTINLVEPMVIEGTGGSFHINGSVNFLSGALDNEMLVTLPVSSSLPWYAAYLGFVNPLAAGAVLVGERIFRNQIEKFSSAKYKVTGTLQDPKVTFVQVFPKALDEPATSVTAAEPAATPTDDSAVAPASGAAPAAPSRTGPVLQSPDDLSHGKDEDNDA
jgi:uncharacterized protein (TIGR02099 family)